MGVNRTLLHRLSLAIAFRRKSIRQRRRVLHCSCHSASKQTMSQGLLLLLQTNLRTEPWEKLYATDASPSGAGGCVAPTTRGAWLAFYDLTEEKGEDVRLDWKGEEPSNMHDGRGAGASLALKLNWATMFSHRFFEGKHINLSELESLVSLLRRVTREVQARRLLVFVDSRVVLGAVSKRRSSSRKTNILLRKLGFWCFACDTTLELVWVPTWANSAGALSRSKKIEKLVCIIAKASASTDRSFCISPRPLGAGSAPWNHCRLRPTQREKMYLGLNPSLLSVVRK